MENLKLKYKMTFDFGDWSNGSHGRTEILDLISNYDVKEISNAYLNSININGINFQEEVAYDYQDQSMPAQKFLECGFNIDNLRYDNDPNRNCRR